ncbi:MAG: hypothetical protein GYB68_09755 [Chloroflexi bacterium]|nr:hypothetical protein [Chloroflexota bacterium]
MQEIASNVYIESKFNRITVGAILIEEGWVCIDSPPHPRDARAWKTALSAIASQPIKYLVNTDHHRDRIINNGWFDGQGVAHEETARALLALKPTFVSQAAEDLSINDNELVEIASLQLHPPEISFSDQLMLTSNGRQISLLHRPSAAAGSLWVLLPEDQVIFAGDSLTVDRHPYIHHGLTSHWLDLLHEVQAEYAGWTIVPGRGSLLQLDKVARLVDYLEHARQQVRGLVENGRNRGDVSLLLAEFMPRYLYETSTRDNVQKRVKLGLELIYDEIKAEVERGQNGALG